MKPERRGWQFWLWGFIFVFLGHALAVLHFGEKELPLAMPEQPRPFLYLSLDDGSDRSISALTLGHDPTLFAMPSPHGFSGGAWLRFNPESLQLTNSSAPPQWLALSAEQLGNTLPEFVTTNRLSEEPLLASLRATRAVEVRIPDEPLVARTTVGMDGPLAARKLLRTPKLPAQIHSDILKRTVVSLAVNGDGLVESASVVRESGLPAADREALELARAFEFEPLPLPAFSARAATAPVVGRLAFTWRVVSTTNELADPRTP